MRQSSAGERGTRGTPTVTDIRARLIGVTTAVSRGGE
jgi:hypothetical protein